MHLLEYRLVAGFLGQKTLRFYFESIGGRRVVEIVRQRCDEDVEPLLLREPLPELLRAVVALIQQLNSDALTCRTENACVKL